MFRLFSGGMILQYLVNVTVVILCEELMNGLQEILRKITVNAEISTISYAIARAEKRFSCTEISNQILHFCK